MLWFTSDQHYGHANIIRYCERPYADVHSMNKDLIERHNSLVAPNDIVYHLGDFTFDRYPDKYLEKLNGQHYLIKGNHDAKKPKSAELFISTQDTALIKWETHLFFLSHYCHTVWPNSHYGSFHLFGHSHGTLRVVGRKMDAGVDNTGYSPISAEEVVRRLGSIDPVVFDHHYQAFSEIL